MFNLAKNDMYHERQVTAEEVLAEISAVTIEDVQHVAMELFQHSNYGIVVVGDLDEFDFRTEDFLMH